MLCTQLLKKERIIKILKIMWNKYSTIIDDWYICIYDYWRVEYSKDNKNIFTNCTLIDWDKFWKIFINNRNNQVYRFIWYDCSYNKVWNMFDWRTFHRKTDIRNFTRDSQEASFIQKIKFIIIEFIYLNDFLRGIFFNWYCSIKFKFLKYFK